MSLNLFSSLSDAMPTLADKEEYLRRMLDNMYKYKKEHGSAAVRIGVTGTGRAPNYRIEPDDYGKKLDEQLEEIDYLKWLNVERHKYYTAFNGLSHRRMNLRIHDFRDLNWTIKAMELKDVAKLLGELRGYWESALKHA